jgi:hypothetical protein
MKRKSPTTIEFFLLRVLWMVFCYIILKTVPPELLAMLLLIVFLNIGDHEA